MIYGTPHIESREVIFENKVIHLIPPTEVSGFVDTATPLVKNLTLCELKNTGATNITNFIGGQEGTAVRFLGDGFSTVVHGSNIKTNTGANKLLAANIIYTFTYLNDVWYEHA
jgi:hypothetical protein